MPFINNFVLFIINKIINKTITHLQFISFTAFNMQLNVLYFGIPFVYPKERSNIFEQKCLSIYWTQLFVGKSSLNSVLLTMTWIFTPDMFIYSVRRL